MNPVQLTLEHVGLRYPGKKNRRRFWRWGEGGYWALKDVSFEVHRGEALGIIGRNGAGKSTLMRVLAGIIRPDRGRFVNHGCRVSLLSLQAGFIPHLTGRENAILSGMLLGLPRKAVEARLPAIIEFAELEEFIDQPVYTYSSGMSARLGFSTAIQVDPEVLLIDEVLGVGDSQFRQKSSAALKELIRSDKTVIMVSHGAGTIRQLCDRAVLMESGTTVAQGSAQAILANYQSRTQQQLENHQSRVHTPLSP